MQPQTTWLHHYFAHTNPRIVLQCITLKLLVDSCILPFLQFAVSVKTSRGQTALHAMAGCQVKSRFSPLRRSLVASPGSHVGYAVPRTHTANVQDMYSTCTRKSQTRARRRKDTGTSMGLGAHARGRTNKLQPHSTLLGLHARECWQSQAASTPRTWTRSSRGHCAVHCEHSPRNLLPGLQ